MKPLSTAFAILLVAAGGLAATAYGFGWPEPVAALLPGATVASSMRRKAATRPLRLVLIVIIIMLPVELNHCEFEN